MKKRSSIKNGKNLKTELTWNSCEQPQDILIWDDVFLHENVETGEKFAILVTVTKIFEEDSRSLRNLKIFTLKVSILIVILADIHEDKLNNFQCFADSSEQQCLLLLIINDWVNNFIQF